MTAQPTPVWLSQPLPGVQVRTVAAAEINRAMTQDIAQRLRDAIAARGKAVLCVSGGKSPIALFEALRAQALDWPKVHVTLADERCVDADHVASNAGLVKAHLLQGPAQAAHWTGLMPEPWVEATPAQWAAHASQQLAQVGAADVLVLGMGEDGHTASLFPAAPHLLQALDAQQPAACLSIELADPPANAPYARITQTLSHLLKARHIVLPVTSKDKHAVLTNAWMSRSTALPISYVLHQVQSPVHVWISV
jgi:6-phosphogluconolactonase